MKRLMVLLVAALTLSGCVPTGALFATSIGLTAVDYMQTQAIKTNPNLYERNPILGKHPSSGKVAAYFLAWAGINTYVYKSERIPDGWKKAYFVGYSLVQIGAVTNNVIVGTGFRLW